MKRPKSSLPGVKSRSGDVGALAVAKSSSGSVSSIIAATANTPTPNRRGSVYSSIVGMIGQASLGGATDAEARKIIPPLSKFFTAPTVVGSIMEVYLAGGALPSGWRNNFQDVLEGAGVSVYNPEQEAFRSEPEDMAEV